MNKLLQEYYASLTDDELAEVLNQIYEKEVKLAWHRYFAKEEKIKREYIKNKKQEKIKGGTNE